MKTTVVFQRNTCSPQTKPTSQPRSSCPPITYFLQIQHTNYQPTKKARSPTSHPSLVLTYFSPVLLTCLFFAQKQYTFYSDKVPSKLNKYSKWTLRRESEPCHHVLCMETIPAETTTEKEVISTSPTNQPPNRALNLGRKPCLPSR